MRSNGAPEISLGLDTRITAIDRALASRLGYEPDALAGRPVSELLSDADLQGFGADLVALVSTPAISTTSERSFRRADESLAPVSVTVTSRRDSDGNLAGFRLVVALTEDISAEQLANRVLLANEELFRSLTERSPVGIARVAPDLSLVYRNPRFAVLAGIGLDEPVSLLDLVHRDDRDRVRTAVGQRITGQDDTPIRSRMQSVDDDRWVSLRLGPVHDDELGLVGHIVTAEDVTDLLKADDAVTTLPGHDGLNGELVGVADLNTKEVLHLNDRAMEFFGIDELGDIDVTALYAAHEHHLYLDVIYPVLRRGEAWTGELTMVDAQGNSRAILQTIAADLDADGQPIRASAVGSDVTNQLRTTDDLVYRATHDQLTGLPNRGLLRDHLELSLARSARDRRPIAVLFVDLDRFKYVNDTYGHDVGDELLREIARRMSDVLRPSDTVARIGGDEFLVLCEDIDGEVDALHIADRIKESLIETEIVIRGVPMQITISIGVAISNGTGTRDGDTLIQQADAAMYRAKKSGRDRIELYDDVLRDRTQRRLDMIGQLDEALEDGTLEVHYQPIVDLVTGRVVSVEAFARWPHPTRGMLTPTAFLELAIEASLDQRLDQAVLAMACQTAAAWRTSLGDDAPRLHVNVTGRTTLSGTLAPVLKTLLADTGLPAESLCLELSERFLMDDGELTEIRLREIRHLGVALAIDDVGTAATSLQRIRHYDLDMLKVDGSLIKGLTTDHDVERLAGAAIALGRALNLRVGIEAVEDPAAIAVLRRLGAQVAQGHVFAAAMPAQKLAPLLSLRSTLARADRPDP